MFNIGGIVLLSITWFFLYVQCHTLNTPPTMWLDRNWKIPDTETVGTVITKVHGSDAENDVLQYGLEPLSHDYYNNRMKLSYLPFRIDNVTGVVYLNESLKGRAGENIFLYVTVDDGDLIAKTEVYVNILNSTLSTLPLYNGNKLRPPSFLSAFNPRPPPSIGNNPSPPIPPPGGGHHQQQQPYFQQKTYFELTTKNSILNLSNQKLNTTHLLPIINNSTDGSRSSTSTTVTSQISNVTTTKTIVNDEDNIIGGQKDIFPIDRPVKSVPDLAVTLIPIISVCVIFLIVGGVALIFRKKICIGRAKSTKDDMRKESSDGVIVQEEDPGFALQQWRGPRAFNNRYEPWERDNDVHTMQATLQLSNGSAQCDRWEFPRHRLKFFNILGEGAFGQVWKCETLEIDGKEGVSVVAVKTLKENATEKERSDLISELQVMKMLEPHPNVVRLLGCCTDKEPIFVIMEYISKGKLQSFLRNSRAERYYNNMHGQSKSLTSRDLTSFVYQVAKGMEFLSSNGIIHRDLAARNILITEDHTCKVADFGFARDIIASYVYERKSEGRLPIRWMAPESLYDNIFSVKSDVWSFGVLIWEVVTLGSTPYPGLSAAEVMRKVRDGHRLDKPEHCRRELYNIMFYCWNKDPKQRPSFTECVELLEKLLMTETDYIELERFPDHSYYNMMSLSGEKL